MENGRYIGEALRCLPLHSDHYIACSRCVWFWLSQIRITDVYVWALHLNAINISLVDQKAIVVLGSISDSLSHLFASHHTCFIHMVLKKKQKQNRNIFLILNEILIFNKLYPDASICIKNMSVPVSHPITLALPPSLLATVTSFFPTTSITTNYHF